MTYRRMAFRCEACGFRVMRSPNVRVCQACGGPLVRLDVMPLLLGADHNGDLRAYRFGLPNPVEIGAYRDDQTWLDWCDVVQAAGYHLGHYVQVQIVPASKRTWPRPIGADLEDTTDE